MRKILPSHWNVMKFSEVAEVITGTTPSTMHPEYYGGKIPFVTPSDLDATLPITSASVTLSELGGSQARLLPSDAIMVCCIGSLGKVGFAGTQLTTNQQINSLIFDHAIAFPRYAYHYCRTLKPLLEHLGPSTTVPIVNKSRFKELPIPLPPLPEQRRIAAILDKANAIRSKRQEAIRLTDEFLRSAFLEIVGPGASEYEKWPEGTVESLALDKKNSMRTGPFGSDLRHSEFVDKGIAVLGIDNAVKNHFAWGELRFITMEKYEKLKRYKIFPGDVIITIMGTTGRSAVIPDDIPPAITTKHLAVITLNRKLAHPEFIAYAIHDHPEILHQIERAQRGAIMNGLNLTLIKELRFRVPPSPIQELFAYIVQKVHKTRDKLSKANKQEDDDLFNSLVQRAFRGEL